MYNTLHLAEDLLPGVVATGLPDVTISWEQTVRNAKRGDRQRDEIPRIGLLYCPVSWLIMLSLSFLGSGRFSFFVLRCSPGFSGSLDAPRGQRRLIRKFCGKERKEEAVRAPRRFRCYIIHNVPPAKLAGRVPQNIQMQTFDNARTRQVPKHVTRNN